MHNMVRAFNGQVERPDLEAIVASGLFEECACGVAAFAAAGADGLTDTNHMTIVFVLATLKNCNDQPQCEARIRSLAPALAWCLENSLAYCEPLGLTSGATAVQICASPATSLCRIWGLV